MNKIRIREFGKLKYADPEGYLVKLRKVEQKIAMSGMPSKVRNLRTNSLKMHRERREAALFCHGMSKKLGMKVKFAPIESQDYDFVTAWIQDDCLNYAPVQLKEAVPTDLNETASIQSIIDSLSKKYVDSQDLTVAIHLNQRTNFDPSKLHIPNLHIAGLWIFGGISEDQSRWGLWGDFLDEPVGVTFEYPTLRTDM